MKMALHHLPDELILLTVSFLDDPGDKAAFLETCRRVYHVTKSDLYRYLAVEEHANVAIHAALAGSSTILELLWPYNTRFVNRLWEHDPTHHLRATPFSDLCYDCATEDCKQPNHRSRQGNSTVSQALLTSVFDRCDMGRVTACFEQPKGKFTLLHFAALYGDCDVIAWLLDHGADIDAVCILECCKEVEDLDGRGPVGDQEYPVLTPLQLALCNRNEEAAKLLIERGASLSSASNRPHSSRLQIPRIDCSTPAICVAAAFGLSDTVRLLLETDERAFETTDERGYTPLHHAADSCWEAEYMGVFSVLEEAGADLSDDQNETRRTPLEIAFRQGNFAAVDCLLAAGSGLLSLERLRLGLEENGGDFLLHFACAFEARARGLRYTQHSCFSISRTDEEKFSSEGWEKARKRLVLRLLDLGYDPNSKVSLDHPWCRDDEDGYRPPRGQVDQRWWESRSHSNMLRRRDVTSLNAVSFDCDPKLLALLIDRGAKVDAMELEGVSLLWRLFINSQLLNKLHSGWSNFYTYPERPYKWQEKMELLLRAGAKIDPWAVSGLGVMQGGTSAQVKGLVLYADTDMFEFLMEKTTALNMSTEALRCLAIGILAVSLKGLGDVSVPHEKRGIIAKYHGPLDTSNMPTETYRAWLIQRGDDD